MHVMQYNDNKDKIQMKESIQIKQNIELKQNKHIIVHVLDIL